MSFPNKEPHKRVTPKIYHTSDHDIDPAHIDADAIYIIQKLRKAGYEAYLVGGSVRDLLKGLKPKDFDISTSALPEEIKAVFRHNCLLIGRRFRLAHIRFGKKIFEVSTFRTGEIDSKELIVHDNEWGTPEEDVLRRDFTINGLLYDPSEHTVIDYAGGWEDIHKGILRTIGNPYARFNQDPVRMIRMLKFQARFGLEVDPEALEALVANTQAITKSSQARILEEMLRMLESGFSEPFFKLLKQHNFLELLFPWLNRFLETEKGEHVYHYLKNVDKLHRTFYRKPLDRSIMLCCLIFPVLQQEIEQKYLMHNKTPHLGEITESVFSLFREISSNSFSRFTRRLSTCASGIIIMQYRMVPFSDRKVRKMRILNSSDFLDSLSFLKIRAMMDESLTEAYHFWQKNLRYHEQSAQPKPPRNRKDVDALAESPEN